MSVIKPVLSSNQEQLKSNEKPDVLELKKTIYEKGMCAIKGAFPRELIQKIRDDYEPLMQEARSVQNGTINRGPNRFYHYVYPEKLTGFVEIISHPAFTGLSEAVLGDKYSIVEVAFDVPLPGAKNQPWHRDFGIPTETRVGRWLSSLAFNLTTVDVTQEMGAFEIAFGTHWEDGTNFDQSMFPPKSEYSRFERIGTRCYPQLGDMSCRTGLTVHRGTEHNANIPRPVLIIGVVSDTILPSNPHRVYMTKPFYNSLPEQVRKHIHVHLTDDLVPIVQKHDIEGLQYESQDGQV